jgi:cytochrome P450
MVDYTQQILADWNTQEALAEPRDIHIDMMQLTLNIVMKAIFNQDVSTSEAKTVARALDVAMDWFDSKRRQNFLIWEWFPRPENIRYRDAISAMNETIYGIIRQRRDSGENPGDLLSMFMSARDEDDGTGMSDQQLRDEIATLMLAGHETTANALSWTWMLLSQNPEAAAKLHAELDQVLEGRLPIEADLPQLPYANAVIQESMRLYPPVSLIGREAVEDVEIGDYLVPKGCVVMLSQWVMHHNPKYFDEPESFQPDRWLGDLEQQLPRGVYFPFGDGPRVCIGKGFALMEAVLILATVAQSYEIELVPEHNIVPQPSITLRPEHGIFVTLKGRS